MTPPLVPTDLRALIAIDLGAESCRISLLRWIDAQPRLTLVHRFATVSHQTSNGLRWDLGVIESGIDEGLRKAADIALEGIRSIAVDGWAVDYVRVDEHGKANADPYCYRDLRTVAAEQSLHAVMSPDRMREITSIGILRINTLYQLYADIPEVRSLRWLNLPEYIMHRLGARPVAEYSNATHTQMIASTTGQWSEEIVAAAGLYLSTFPETVLPGSLIGRLTGPLQRLKPFADTVLLAPAAHDTASAIAGIPAHGDDWAYISSGTWSLVGAVLLEPNNSPAAKTDNFTNLGGAGGLTLFHKNINGLWLLKQCIEHWAAGGKTWTVPALVAAAETLAPPTALLYVNDADLLLPGEMPLRIRAQLAARGMTVDPNEAPVVANLIFHSLAAEYADVLARLSLHTGKTFKRLYIVGGGSQNLFLNRLTAATTGLQVLRGSEESSTLGNFAVQLACLENRTASPIGAAQICAWSSILQGASVKQH